MNKIISVYDLNGIKIQQYTEIDTVAKFPTRGLKMYVSKIEDMIDVLSKEEFKRILRIFDDSNSVNMAGVLKVPFLRCTLGMKPVARSRFKKKLIDFNIATEHNKKLMLNPLIFETRNDKNIENFRYKVQRIYKYLQEDKDLYSEWMDGFVEYIFEFQ